MRDKLQRISTIVLIDFESLISILLEYKFALLSFCCLVSYQSLALTISLRYPKPLLTISL